MKRVLGIRAIERIYDRLHAEPENQTSAAAFCLNGLRELGVTVDWPRETIAQLRSIEGPLIFVANHPFGSVDALVLMALMGEVRRDFKFIGNAMLDILPELSAVLLPVNIMGDDVKTSTNVGNMRRVLGYLRQGGILGIFPAGEVATFASWTSRTVTERPWTTHLGQLVKRTRATVVPVYFDGRNSAFFQYLGLAWADLRIALLVGETLRHRGAAKMTVGAPIAYAESYARMSAEALTLEFRRQAFALAPVKTPVNTKEAKR